MNQYLNRISNFLFNQQIRFGYLSTIGFYNWMPDELYLKKEFKLRMGKELNLDAPQTFNEKLQWLKLHNCKPEYTIMVDKYAVKQYVADRIGDEYIIPTLGVWNHFDDINFHTLPNEFVLKCTHDSGGLVICKDKSTFDKTDAKRRIEHCLRRKYYYIHREWPYKNVPPRIIAEQYMTEEENQELIDYKMMCFNSKVKATFVCTNRFNSQGMNVTFYNTEWERLPFERHYPASKVDIEKPKTYDEMVRLAEKLSEKIPFVRVDFYEIRGKVYFGELTFYPGSGFEEFSPEQWDKTLGEWLQLPEQKFGGGVIVNQGYVLWVHLEENTYISRKENSGLTDYKFYCFDGTPRFLYISQGLDNHATAQISFVDLEWNCMNFGRKDYRSFDELPPKPACFEKMKAVAMRLSENIPFVRVDLYEVNGEVYFSEMTFYPCSGYMPFDPPEADAEIGNLLDISHMQ